MPKGQDYSRGKIYQIKCLTTGKVYIGSTIQKYLSQRLAGHIADFKKCQGGGYNYLTSFEVLKHDNYQITLLEPYPCSSCDELHARERHWIESTKCVNKVIPTRSCKEYREANKEQISQRKGRYYEDNKEQISQYQKQYREANKEKSKQYYEDNKEKSKQYYEDNKERISQYQKQYREANKEKSKQYYEDNKEKFKQYYQVNKEKIKQYYLSKKSEV